MCGSGKSVVTDYLVQKGYSRIYFGELTLSAVRERGLAITPDNERIVRETLRKELGWDAYAKKMYPEIIEKSKSDNVVIDGLYTWSEYKYLSERLGCQLTVIAVISDRSKRYDRLKNRTVRPLSESEAIKRDYAEIDNLEKGGPIAIADYFVTNNSSIEHLIDQIENVLSALV